MNGAASRHGNTSYVSLLLAEGSDPWKVEMQRELAAMEAELDSHVEVLEQAATSIGLDEEYISNLKTSKETVATILATIDEENPSPLSDTQETRLSDAVTDLRDRAAGLLEDS